MNGAPADSGLVLVREREGGRMGTVARGFNMAGPKLPITTTFLDTIQQFNAILILK